MKMISTVRGFATKIMATLFLALLQVKLFAQEKGIDIDVDIDKKEDEWYRQPWVWVVGGAVFILLLVAILRSNRKD